MYPLILHLDSLPLHHVDLRRHSSMQMWASWTESSSGKYLMNLIKIALRRQCCAHGLRFQSSLIITFHFDICFTPLTQCVCVVCVCVVCAFCPAPSLASVQLPSSAETPGDLQSLLSHYTWQCGGTGQCHVHICKLHTYTRTHIYRYRYRSIYSIYSLYTPSHYQWQYYLCVCFRLSWY